MHISTNLLSLAAALALLGIGQASAQGTSNPQGGTTTGPAVGSPATLGTGGVTSATPHQSDSVRNRGGVPITAERRGQQGGTQPTVKPGASDAGAGVHNTPR